jgi:hypothetical protein
MNKQNYFSEKIINLISENILNFNIEEIKDFYKSFNEGKTIEISAEKTKNIYFDFLNNGIVKHKQFDLPYYLDFKKEKTIMIVGMDAKASHEDDSVVVLSTPYYLQSNEGRETNKNDYWKIIKILSNHYNIFLTDVYKAYFKSTDISNRIPQYKKNNLHSEILKQEIKEIKPSAILCWGKDSRTLVAKIVSVKLLGLISKDSNYPYHCTGGFSDIRLIATPHPSNSTYEKDWISFYNANLSNTPYIKKNRPVDLANFILNKLE